MCRSWWKWVNARDGERKVWVILVGEPQARGLNTEAEAPRVAVEWLALGRRIEELELVEAQDTLVDLPGLLASTYDFDHVTERCDDEYLNRLRKDRPVDDDAWFQFTRVHLTPPVTVPRIKVGLIV
jgi:hypothetical protein